MADKPRATPYLVVIGASAGGIAALSTLVATLPKDFPAPILIAQHLDPSRTSHLESILAERSTVPVRTVADHAVLEPGVVFVVPANRHVEVTERDVRLRADDHGSPRPSIDLLLRSAAQVYGERLVAAILTGAGSDGTAGARQVKQHGGVVIIQDPATAPFPSMPLSLAPTTVDVAVAVEQMGPLLARLIGDGSFAALPDREHSLQSFLTRVRERVGIDFSTYKTPTMQRRLQRRLVATDSSSLEEYERYLEQHPEEYQRLVNTFLIKVTEFFRDQELFDYLRTQVVPALVAEGRQREYTLRLWSAGCATGEEAYSLAMLVADALGNDLDRFTVRIFATDLDADAVAFARRGIYPAAALSTLPPDVIARHFVRIDDECMVKKRIRSLVVFGQHDLGQRPPFPQIDLVLCRNVLIYFTPELQRRALQLFAFALREQGYLVLGKAETTSPLPDYFKAEQATLRIYRRHGERMLFPPERLREAELPKTRDITQPHVPVPRHLLPLPARREQQRPLLSPELPAHVLLRQLGAGVVVVDQRYDVQMMNAAARRFFGIHQSAIGEDFLHLVQNVSPSPLRRAIDQAFTEEGPVLIDELVSVDVATNETRYLQVACQRSEDDRPDTALPNVVVQTLDVTRFVEQRQADVAEHERDAQEQRQRLAAINAELETARRREVERTEQVQSLAATNRRLQQANEELASANTALRAENDEFILNTEEAQAAAEEVETLNEELQATNEELETLNEELQSTVEELHTTNDDLEARSHEIEAVATASEAERTRLEAILTGLGDAVLVVDHAGDAVLVNAAYTEQFGDPSQVLPTEDAEGRPLAANDTPRQRAALGETFVMDFAVVQPDGSRRWYEAHGRPVQFDSGQQGVVVIRDVTERSLRHFQEEFLALTSHELNTPLTIIRGTLQMLQRSLSGASEQARQHAAAALEQERQIEALARDLVDVVRLQRGQLRVDLAPLDLRDIVRQTVEVAQPLAERQRMTLQLPDDPVTVNGDAGRLQQVVLNLLTNAIRYAPNSDRIDVRLRTVDQQAELQVQDYGPGINAADVSRLFTSYFQGPSSARSRRAGLGLGLYLCRQIVQAHGGTIDVASAPGAGATFTVHLPLA